jgi:hypothetical protein
MAAVVPMKNEPTGDATDHRGDLVFEEHRQLRTPE